MRSSSSVLHLRLTGPLERVRVEPLEDFVRAYVPSGKVVGRPRSAGPVHVAELVDGRGQRWFAKHLVHWRAFDAEVRAYHHWADLSFTPELIAVDTDRRCLLLSRLPGSQPRGGSQRLFRAAGRRLQRMHAVPPSAAWEEGWHREVRLDVRRHLSQLHRRAEPMPEARIWRSVRELSALEDLPLAVTHGDYQPHNWRWHMQHRLYVFDFAGAALRPAVHDLTRLRYAACWDRPDLLDGVLTGYGRSLTADEQRYLELSLTIRAVIGLNLGLRWRQRCMIDHARLVLNTQEGDGDVRSNGEAVGSRRLRRGISGMDFR